MGILWIIYFVIGTILGCVTIYGIMHDEEVFNEEKEMNALINNCGTIVIFVIGILVALFIALLWPLVIILGIIKLSKKKGNK